MPICQIFLIVFLKFVSDFGQEIKRVCPNGGGWSVLDCLFGGDIPREDFFELNNFQYYE